MALGVRRCLVKKFTIKTTEVMNDAITGLNFNYAMNTMSHVNKLRRFGVLDSTDIAHKVIRVTAQALRQALKTYCEFYGMHETYCRIILTLQ